VPFWFSGSMRSLCPCARAYDREMKGKRTPAWWWSRCEVAIAIGAVLLIVFGVWSGIQDTFFGGPPMVEVGPLLMRAQTLISVLALVGSIVGLVWIIRLMRGPRDEPPRWRYRGR
jgi:hypothetical protein